MKTSSKKWRLMDTGVATALENIAVDAALLNAREQHDLPNTLRFLQYSPAAALVGYFQSPAQELRTDFCRRNGIDIQRRITGGGAILFDKSHLGWEITGSRKDFGYRLDDMTRMICEGVTAGLRRLGITAAFRPRNDIEVDGRKISGTGGVFEGDALLFQGTLLVDLDVETMVKSLRVPTEKLSARGLSSIRERVTSLKDELGYLPPLDEVKAALQAGFEEIFGVTFFPGSLSPEEEALATGFIEEYRQNGWIDLVADPPEEHLILRSVVKLDGGLIRAAASVDSRRRILKYALITGDFFVSPRRAIFDLEAALKNTPVAEAGRRIRRFFEENEVEMPGLAPEDFQSAMEQALSKLDLVNYGIDLEEADSIFTVNGSFADSLGSCSLLLLPYCAKLIECEFREVDGCEQCGKCSIGSAYEMAGRLGLEVITIHDYEHLRDTLDACRESGVKSYIGCCCEAFFVKHQQTFRDAGIPAALIDIEKATCYELHSEEQAYAGRFENQTDLKLGLLEKVLGNVREARRCLNVMYW